MPDFTLVAALRTHVIAEFADGKHTFKGVRPRPVDNPLPSGRPA
jgi:hypothetical protein